MRETLERMGITKLKDQKFVITVAAVRVIPETHPSDILMQELDRIGRQIEAASIEEPSSHGMLMAQLIVLYKHMLQAGTALEPTLNVANQQLEELGKGLGAFGEDLTQRTGVSHCVDGMNDIVTYDTQVNCVRTFCDIWLCVSAVRRFNAMSRHNHVASWLNTCVRSCHPLLLLLLLLHMITKVRNVLLPETTVKPLSDPPKNNPSYWHSSRGCVQR